MALSPHHHTGRHLPHRHTSYAGLGFVLLMVGVLLAGITGFTLADTLTADGSYSVHAAVVPPPPTHAPTITTPINGQHFSNSPISVKGTCDAGMIVSVFKNDVLSGSALCDASGHYTVQSDLFIGQNELVARLVDLANQSGPDSNKVTVTYDVATAPTSLSGGTNVGTHGNLILRSDRAYQGAVPGTEISWKIEILGGAAPYAVSIEWGDGQTELLSRQADGQFTIQHTYQKEGGYKGGYVVTVKAADTEGVTATLQLVGLVNNPVGTVVATTAGPPSNWWRLLVTWPLWVVAILLLLAFWLGERRQRHEDQGQMPVYAASGV